MGNAAINKLEKELGVNFPVGAHFVGLENKSGTICYSNSVIQALYHSMSFRDRLILSRTPKNRESLVGQLADLFETMNNFKKKVGAVSSKKFMLKVRKSNALYDNEEHQDAHEFLIYILNELNDILIKEQKAIRPSKAILEQLENKRDEQPLKSWICDIFEGELACLTRCLCCETVSKRIEPFFHLSLDITQNASLTYSLSNYFTKEVLKGSNKFYCEECCCLQEAEKSSKIKKLPETLIIHFKRFKFIPSKGLRKLNWTVMFPLELRISEMDSGFADSLYELSAIIIHLGHGLHIGHYISFIKFDEIWAKFDDSSVSLADDKDFRAIFGNNLTMENEGWPCAYILFYQRKRIHVKQAIL